MDAVTLYKASSFSGGYKIRSFPKVVFYNNVEYYIGSDIGEYAGIENGGIYIIPQIGLSRVDITKRMRAEIVEEIREYAISTTVLVSKERQHLPLMLTGLEMPKTSRFSSIDQWKLYFGLLVLENDHERSPT